MKLIAILLSLLLLAAYAYVIFKFSTELLKAVTTIKNKPLRAVYYLSLLIPGIALCVLLKNEQFVYFWDYSGYWHRGIMFAHEFFTTPLQSLKGVYNSVRHEEYNTLPNVLLTPVNKILGLSFSNYVLSIYLVYILPFSLVFSSIIIRLHPDLHKWMKIALPFFILFFAPCLIPSRYGFLDAVGLVYMTLAMSILFRNNFLRELKIKQSVLLGLILLLLIFNRRWYAFWFVAFYFSVFAVNMLNAIINKKRNIVIPTIINLSIAGAVSLIIMLTLFYPFFEMTVLKDYTDIYSAYRTTPYLSQFKGINNYFGLFTVLISLTGLIISFKRNRTMACFFCISSLIIVVMFIRVNDFGGLQHYYLLVPFFLIFFMEAVVFASRNKYLPPILLTLLFLNCLFVFAINPASANNYIFSKTEGKPFFRPDYTEINKIADRIIQLQEQGSRIYCLASGGTLNEDIIKNIKLPDIQNPIFKLLRTQHLDKRDRFPNELFIANYVITTLPAELHLGAENQKVIAYFNESIMYGQLKPHYKIVEKFKLKDNVTAYLMQKVSGLSNQEINTIQDYFKKSYPDYKQMYTVHPTEMKLSSITHGDGYGEVRFENDSTAYIIPGSNRPSEISFIPSQNEKTISFTTTFNDKENIKKSCGGDKGGEVYLIIQNGDEVIKKHITHKEDQDISIDITPGKKVILTVNKGINDDSCDWFKLTNIKIR